MRLFFVSFLVACCTLSALSKSGTPASGSSPVVYWVPFGELLRNGDKYDGKRIAVVGYYVMEAPYSELYCIEPKTVANPVLLGGKVLWIGKSEDGNKSVAAERKNGKWFVVIGTYSNKPLGHFDRYFGSVEEIEAMYLLDHAPEGGLHCITNGS